MRISDWSSDVCSSDLVPRPDAYFDPINWHRTAFHELSHWVGGRSRLDRDQTGAFGSKEYGRAALIAEMGGAFVCAALGIVPTFRQAAHLGSWLAIIRKDHQSGRASVRERVCRYGYICRVVVIFKKKK